MYPTPVLRHGDATASLRVSAAWRELGAHALAFHREELARDIAGLRRPTDPSDHRRSRRWNPVLRQRLKLLAATY
jgi:hypothetical protein